MGNVHTVLDRCGELREVLTETSIARNRNHFATFESGVVLLRRRPCAHRRGEAEADRTEVSGHQDRLPFTLEVASE